MTIYEEIIEEGRVKGREEGEFRGVLIGQILMLQDLLSESVWSRQELSACSTDQLQARRDDLKRRWPARP